MPFENRRQDTVRSGVVLECLGPLPQLYSRGVYGSSSGDSSPGFSEEIPSTGSIPDISGRSNTLHAPGSVPRQRTRGRAKKTAGQILKFEESCQETAKPAATLWQGWLLAVVAVVMAVASSAWEQLKGFVEFVGLKQRQEHQRVTKRSFSRRATLKKKKIHNLQLQEAEQQCLKEAELGHQAEELRNLNTTQEDILVQIGKSKKAKTRFDPYWFERGEDIMAGYTDVLSLSPQAGVTLEHLCQLPQLSPSFPEETPSTGQEKAEPALTQQQEKAVAAVTPAVTPVVASSARKQSPHRMERDMKEVHIILPPRNLKTLKRRQREAERQRLKEAELERQAVIQKYLDIIEKEIPPLNQLLDPSNEAKDDLPAASASSLSTRGSQLCLQESEVVHKTAEGEFPSTELQVQQEAPRVELQVHQEAQEAERAVKEREQERGLQNSAEDSSLKLFRELQDLAAQCSQSCEEFRSSKDVQTKKLRFGLQKAACTPVSQISINSCSHLKEIFDRINNVLSGHQVTSGGNSFSTSQHPQSLHFISYKVAEKFVKQGEEEVTSHHEAAFPIAVVASALWELHPRLGDLLLAHLHQKCPYTVPYYPSKEENMTDEEYQRILGYLFDGSEVEDHDVFLKRMSGMIRLYAAIIVSSKHESTHSLNHGWRWLAQMLNMKPLPDITATLLFDFLEVCGNALMKEYQLQFWKLILVLKDHYLPKIEAVTIEGRMAPVIRLTEFLETSLESRHISPPKGQLSSTFWRA